MATQTLNLNAQTIVDMQNARAQGTLQNDTDLLTFLNVNKVAGDDYVINIDKASIATEPMQHELYAAVGRLLHILADTTLNTQNIANSVTIKFA